MDKNPLFTTPLNIFAIVGMPGSGKSIVSSIFEKNGFKLIRFGDVTEEILRQHGLEVNEENERSVRNNLRQEMGMHAYALRSEDRINTALNNRERVVIDGMYSWEEYKYLISKFDKMQTVLVFTPASLRYERLVNRLVRPLTMDQAKARDYSEIEEINKGGPIAMADHLITNLEGKDELEMKVTDFINKTK